MTKTEMKKQNAEFNKFGVGAFKSLRTARRFAAGYVDERVVVKVGNVFAVMTRGAANLNGHKVIS